MAAPPPTDDISGIVSVWEWLKGGLGAAIGAALGFMLWTFRGGLTVGKTVENMDGRFRTLEEAARANVEAIKELREARRQADIDVAKLPDREELEKVRDSIQRQMQDVQKQINDATVMILQTVRGHREPRT